MSVRYSTVRALRASRSSWPTASAPATRLTRAISVAVSEQQKSLPSLAASPSRTSPAVMAPLIGTGRAICNKFGGLGSRLAMGHLLVASAGSTPPARGAAIGQVIGATLGMTVVTAGLLA